MTSNIDGTYALVVTSVAGASMLALSIRDGKIEGNDIAGSRYTGTATAVGDNMIRIDLKADMPPNTFAVWGTSASETWMTREDSATLPIDKILSGEPIRIDHLAMWAVFQRIPDDAAWQAGEDGYDAFADMVASLAAARRARRHVVEPV
jgi:hypothetical protein